MDRWWSSLDAKKRTWNAHAYALLRSVLKSAHKRKLIGDVPSIDGAGRSKRRRPLRPIADPAELNALVAAMPERYRLLTLVMAWCALRYGEATALRRRDVDLKAGVVHVDRGVTRTKGKWHEDTPKAGEEADVAVPPHLLDDLAEHCRGLHRDDLLFPAPRGGFLIAATYSKVFRAAAAAIGRPDLRPHDLRHTGLFWAAEAGASPQELKQRGRHKTAQASQVYWHAAKARDAEIAKQMSAMAAADNVVPIGSAKSKRRRGAAAKRA
jgi:integrase